MIRSSLYGWWYLIDIKGNDDTAYTRACSEPHLCALTFIVKYRLKFRTIGLRLHHSLGLSCMCSTINSSSCAGSTVGFTNLCILVQTRAWCCTSTMQVALHVVCAHLGDDIRVINMTQLRWSDLEWSELCWGVTEQLVSILSVQQY